MTARTRQLRQDNRDGKTMAAERGYLGQDIQLRQGNRDGTAMAGQSRYSSWDRTTETGQPGQVNLDGTA
jgi:hypothetical protein